MQNDEVMKIQKLLVVELEKLKSALNGVGQSLVRDNLGRVLCLDEVPGALSIARPDIEPQKYALLRIVHDPETDPRRALLADLSGVEIQEIIDGECADAERIVKILCDKVCVFNMAAKYMVMGVLREMNRKIPVCERPDLYVDL